MAVGAQPEERTEEGAAGSCRSRTAQSLPHQASESDELGAVASPGALLAPKSYQLPTVGVQCPGPRKWVFLGPCGRGPTSPFLYDGTENAPAAEVPWGPPTWRAAGASEGSDRQCGFPQGSSGPRRRGRASWESGVRGIAPGFALPPFLRLKRELRAGVERWPPRLAQRPQREHTCDRA